MELAEDDNVSVGGRPAGCVLSDAEHILLIATTAPSVPLQAPKWCAPGLKVMYKGEPECTVISIEAPLPGDTDIFCSVRTPPRGGQGGRDIQTSLSHLEPPKRAGKEKAAGHHTHNHTHTHTHTHAHTHAADPFADDGAGAAREYLPPRQPVFDATAEAAAASARESASNETILFGVAFAVASNYDEYAAALDGAAFTEIDWRDGNILAAEEMCEKAAMLEQMSGDALYVCC